jgi:ABC-type sugar transport system ATPase subunit
MTYPDNIPRRPAATDARRPRCTTAKGPASWLLALALLAVPAAADIIHYKHGRMLEGRIVSRTATELTVETEFGTIKVPMSKVASIEEKLLEPKLAILDETDSGLDIDALKIVANGVNKLRSKNNAVIVVTHYQRLLEYIVPDFVHVLYKGKIVKSGTKELALELEAKGYDWIKEEMTV